MSHELTGPDGGRRGLLRFATAGSVDDGKSTLIGRLLFDSKTIFEDQLEAVERSSVDRGLESVNLALLTDGLKAEREQGITIDVAYRYFSTPRRKFIIADTPGHEQYTRNMVTGASTADLTILLVDARRGIVEQTRRHAFIASLLRIPHVVVAVNKMDLVGYASEVFEGIRRDFEAFAGKLALGSLTFIPISALNGDNIVERSGSMPWYEGATLLDHLEAVEVGQSSPDVPARLPVQWVIRPQSDLWHDYRGFAGQVAAGVFTEGQRVAVLPSGLESTIAAIDAHETSLERAGEGQSVAVRLADEIDVSRGDMIVASEGRPRVTSEFEAMVCWLHDKPLQPGGRYALRHTTRDARAIVRELKHRVDVHTLAEVDAPQLAMNDIGRIRLKTTVPLFVDTYAENRTTGAFILIDEATNATVGAGMVLPPEPPGADFEI